MDLPFLNSFITVDNAGEKNIRSLLKLSHKCKKEGIQKKMTRKQYLLGKTIALLFEKPSTRTRASFETSISEEGGGAIFLSKNDLHLGDKESIEDTARVLGGMFSAIVFRGNKQNNCEILQRESGIPVINALTDTHHPTQALADIMTIQEHFKDLRIKKDCIVSFVGDGCNNVACSLITICAMLGIRIHIASSKHYFPSKETLVIARRYAKKNKSEIHMDEDIKKMLKGADVVYTDTWVSMGEKESSVKIKRCKPYKVTQEVMKMAKKDAIFMHCLPAKRGYEVSDEVINGKQSRVWQQAENKKHSAKAVLLACLKII